MRRIRLIVSYDGSGYFGSQIQPNAVTVEQKLNEAVQGLTGAPAQVVFASRTDTGVHALGNVAVFDTEFPMRAERFATALNAYLPQDIRVQAADEVDLSWHPRKQHCEKTYEYRIWNGRIMNPLLRNSAAHCYVPLDLRAMRAALPFLLGEHDFAAFCASGSAAAHTVRRIYRAELSAECEESGSFAGLITFRVTGSGFLYHMVRILAGTLLEIGSGKKSETAFRDAIRSRRRRDAGPVAPAAGLILREIRYLPNPSRYEAENEDWAYELTQDTLEERRESFFTLRRCREADYEGLMTRLIHESHRDGAERVYLRDLEDGSRLFSGREFGFYRIEENADPATREAFPFVALDTKECRKKAPSALTEGGQVSII